MRAASLLAQGRSADQRERIFRNFETYAAQGQWIPAITAAQFPILFYVSEPQRQQQLSGAIAEAQRKGELQLPSGAEPQGLLPLQWAAWEGLPPVPPDSPLIHWLPRWVKRATTDSDESLQEVSSDARQGVEPPAANSPAFLKTDDLAKAFDGVHFTYGQWGKNIGKGIPKWMRSAYMKSGTRGNGSKQALWNPVRMAVELMAKKSVTLDKLDKEFATKAELKPWRDDWREATDYLRDG